jgi:hypothetical protein
MNHFKYNIKKYIGLICAILLLIIYFGYNFHMPVPALPPPSPLIEYKETSLKFDFDKDFQSRLKKVTEKYRNGEYGDELFYLASGIQKNGNGDIILTIKDDTAHISFHEFHSGGRTISRKLSKKELDSLQKMVRDEDVDTLKDYDNQNVADGIDYQYLHFTKKGSDGFYISNPNAGKDGELHQKLVNLFLGYLDTGVFEVVYEMGETLIKKEDYLVEAVWKEGADFRILVKEGQKAQWYSFDGEKVGEQVTEPNGYMLEDIWGDIPGENEEEPGQYRYDEYQNNYPWQITWNTYRIRALKSFDANVNGLWATKAGKEPRLICEGFYFNPVVIPGTDWVVCSKSENEDISQAGGAHPYDLVRINIRTHQELFIDLPPSESINPLILYKGKVLIVQHDSNDRIYKIYFYDPVLDKIMKPLIVQDSTMKQWDIDVIIRRARKRFLQPTGKPDEFYAVSNRKLGVFNMKTMDFKIIRQYRRIRMDSEDIWVDKTEEKVYFVKDNELISLPLLY